MSMNLMSCTNCGVLIDKDILHFDNIRNERTMINNLSEMFTTTEYPICHKKTCDKFGE